MVGQYVVVIGVSRRWGGESKGRKTEWSFSTWMCTALGSIAPHSLTNTSITTTTFSLQPLLLPATTITFTPLKIPQPSVGIIVWYGTGPLMCILSTTYAPPVFKECAFILATSSLIMESFPARVRGVNRLRFRVIFQSGRLCTPRAPSMFCSTNDFPRTQSTFNMSYSRVINLQNLLRDHDRIS